MSANRLFNIVIVLSLGTVIFFTFRLATAMTAIARADRSYDVVEAARLGRSLVSPDQSYEQVEAVRLERSLHAPDQSYDQLEVLPAQAAHARRVSLITSSA